MQVSILRMTLFFSPAMIPVSTWLTSGLLSRAAARMSMNMVGVPYIEVHRSASIASTQAAPLKLGQGRMLVAPWSIPHRVPITQPKQ